MLAVPLKGIHDLLGYVAITTGLLEAAPETMKWVFGVPDATRHKEVVEEFREWGGVISVVTHWQIGE